MRGAPRRSEWGASSGAAGRSTSSNARRWASRASHAPPAIRPERRAERHSERHIRGEALREAISEAISEALTLAITWQWYMQSVAISGHQWRSVAITLTIAWQWYRICCNQLQSSVITLTIAWQWYRICWLGICSPARMIVPFSNLRPLECMQLPGPSGCTKTYAMHTAKDS
jgi:hypothetical protein